MVGPEIGLPNANKAFYRVVAIDARGNESGPSDYIAVPRPFIYTAPKSNATVGSTYRYQAHSTRSIGDLTYEMGIEAFWACENLTWKLVSAPSWLELKNDVLLGTPDAGAVGEHRIRLAVENDAGARAEQEFVISVVE